LPRNDFLKEEDIMIHEKCPDILKDKRILALDIESTGLSTIYNTIIELGVIEVINGEVKTEYTKLFGGGHS
jgi:DNA polymerase-3 subunit alpha (Gram-positive type)